MHSRIIELGDQKIETEDGLSIFDIPDWFYASIADYADKSEDRDGDIDWFARFLGNAAICSKSGELKFFSDAKEKYFQDKFDDFIKKCKELSGITVSEFAGASGDIGYEMYLLGSFYNDKFGFYIFYDDNLVTIDEWIRSADLSKTYYIGGILDYHY